MLQLTIEEALTSRSQPVIFKRSRGHTVEFLPYVFTEYGAIQAATIVTVNETCSLLDQPPE